MTDLFGIFNSSQIFTRLFEQVIGFCPRIEYTPEIIRLGVILLVALVTLKYFGSKTNKQQDIIAGMEMIITSMICVMLALYMDQNGWSMIAGIVFIMFVFIPFGVGVIYCIKGIVINVFEWRKRKDNTFMEKADINLKN